MNEGWIKLHRQLKEWQHYQEPFVLLVWLDLLLSANMKAGWVRGNRINRGQLITSVARIMESTGIGSDNTVRDALRKLEESGEIKREQIGIGTKITINHFNKFQTSAQNAQPSAQPTAEVGAYTSAEVGAQHTAQPGADKQECKKEEKDKNLRKKEDEDDNARGSVVVSLLNFLKNIFGDFNFTPSQVQLIMSKPADYWDSFMDEVQASKWLKTKDPALALRLHEKVVAGEYRTYPDKAKPDTIPQPAPYKPTPEEQQLNDLLYEWRTLPNDAYKGDNLEEMRKRHGQLPDEFLKSIGMCFFRGSWYWKS